MSRVLGALVGALLILGAMFLAAPAALAVPRTLSVNVIGTGDGVVESSPAGIDCANDGGDCSAVFDDAVNPTVTLTADPDEFSEFDGWSGACVGTGPCTVSFAGANKSVTAEFTKVKAELEVRVSGIGNGDVTSTPFGIHCPGDCTHIFDLNELVTLEADPDFDSRLADWSACAGTSACTVEMDRNRTVIASFDLRDFTLHVRTLGNGVGRVTGAGISCPGDCTQAIQAGDSVTLFADAATNSRFDGWNVCGRTSSCSFTMNDRRTVTATFDARSYRSNVTISFVRPSGALRGAVVSEQGRCESNRTVVVKRSRPGADSVQARVLTRRLGAWSARGFRDASGRFYAQVLERRVLDFNGARITCRPDTSRTVRLR